MLRWGEPRILSSGGVMANSIERRASRRFTMTLPLTIRATGPDGGIERQGQTRDVSFRGLYFLIDAEFEAGSSIEFVLTLPREITMAGDVHIRCFAQIIRVEPHNGRRRMPAHPPQTRGASHGPLRISPCHSPGLIPESLIMARASPRSRLFSSRIIPY